jgi:hypothetical protein
MMLEEFEILNEIPYRIPISLVPSLPPSRVPHLRPLPY